MVDDVLRRGRITSLYPVTPSNLFELLAISLVPEVAEGWRYRGASVAPNEALTELLHNYALSMAVLRVSSDRVIGFVGFYGVDYPARTGYFSIFMDPNSAPGAAGEASLLAIDLAFERLNLRKVYAEVPAHNMDKLNPGIGQFMDAEVVMSGKEIVRGTPSDVTIFGVSQKDWVERTRRYRILLGFRRPTSGEGGC